MKTRIKVLGNGRYVPQVKTFFGWRPIWIDVNGFTQVFSTESEKHCVHCYREDAEKVIDRHIKPVGVTYIEYP